MIKYKSIKIPFLAAGLIIVLITGCQSNTNEKASESSKTDSEVRSVDESNSSDTEVWAETEESEIVSDTLTTDTSNTSEMEIWEENESTESATVEISVNQDGILEIEEDKFVAQVGEIYNYPDKYLGETVKYEGYLYLEQYEGKDYYYVVRNTYGCECGEEESIVGFEIKWGGDMPEEGTWIAVTGVLDSYIEEENEYLLVETSNLNIVAEAGQIFVTE